LSDSAKIKNPVGAYSYRIFDFFDYPFFSLVKKVSFEVQLIELWTVDRLQTVVCQPLTI
jgi:hypothetical protein